MYQTRPILDGIGRAGLRIAAVLACICFVVLIGSCKPGGPAEPEGNGPDPQEQRFSVTLEWNAPSEDADGNPLEDLLGYRIHYRDASPANGPGAGVRDVGDTTRSTVDELPAGTWFFGVTARDVSGNESTMSNEIRIEVGP